MSDLFYTMELKVNKYFSNQELMYFNFFHKKVNVYPTNIVFIKDYIFYFVKNEDYFKAKHQIKHLRYKLQDKRIGIIREESTIIKMLFALFPDVYINDIKMRFNDITGDIIMTICVLSYEQRGIAIGSKGSYIKAVNELFNKCIFPLKVKCVVEAI